MSQENRDIGYALFGFFFGIYSFFRGFKRLRRKRLIENLPTSTIRGLAMGMVEISGKIKPASQMFSPLTRTKCALYHYTIEEYRSSGKSGRWVIIAQGNSYDFPFFVDDGTGRIMVFPRQAEIIWPHDYKFQIGLGKKIPANLIEFMESNNIKYRSWLGQRSLRFTEFFLCEDETIYVLGTARNNSPILADSYKEKLVERLENLKIDPEKMKKLDLNKDGSVSLDEWDTAVRKIESELLEKTLNNLSKEGLQDAIISWSDIDRVFIISDRSEKELLKKLSWESLLGIYGGPALSIATLAYLILRFTKFWH